jgi:hypothetical protein
MNISTHVEYVAETISTILRICKYIVANIPGKEAGIFCSAPLYLD